MSDSLSFRFTLFVQQVVWPLLAVGVLARGRRRASGIWDRASYGLLAVGYMAFGALAGRWDVLATWLRPTLLAATTVAALLFVVLFRNTTPAGERAHRGKVWPRILLGVSMASLVLVTRLEGAPAAAVALDFPLSNGEFYVVQGGASYLLNYHRVSAAQKFALDITKLGPGARRAAGVLPNVPQAYFVYGNDVIAPCAGRVRYALDGLADSSIPSGDVHDPAGNYVAIDCSGKEVTVLLAHLREGSLRVHTGDNVTSGQLLASAGQSGHSSEPHLHIHAARDTDDRGLRGVGVPISFGDRFLIKNDTFVADLRPVAVSNDSHQRP